MVTYDTTKAPGDKNPSFVRYTELWWRDIEAVLEAWASPQGQAAMEDAITPEGDHRLILDTPFFGGPALIGFEVNIV